MGDPYGEIDIKIVDKDKSFNITREIVCIEEFKLLEEDDPSQAVDMNTTQCIYTGQIHIILHPAYNIPAPFVRIWSQSGQLMKEEWMQQLMKTHSASMNWKYHRAHHKEEAVPKNNSVVTDYREYELGTFLIDIHPIFQNYCLTFHICDLYDQLAVLIREEPHEERVAGMYMLSWLSHVGPYLGIAIPPETFRRLETIFRSVR